MNLIEKVFGTHSERELKLIRPIVDKILGMREQMTALSDDELRDNTRKFKERLANGETLDDLLPEAFATVREAARRVLNMEHYPVQLIGGIVLHQGLVKPDHDGWKTDRGGLCRTEGDDPGRSQGTGAGDPASGRH